VTVVLEAKGLGKRYGCHWGLSDCNVRVPTGTVAALVGPNGAGKTTLLHLAVGLLSPSAASVEIPTDRCRAAQP
jgi:ABC-2 type transport system ATP-binding protein